MSTKPHTNTPYELLYWPGIPGRGEFIRLAFEVTGTPYRDVGNEKNGVKEITDLLSSKDSSSYPLFAPPMLRVTQSGSDGGLVIHQTPSILIYLAGKLGLDGGDSEANQAAARQIMLTALDLTNEAHDTHHPVAVAEYYEDQKDEGLRKAIDFRKNRVPKFFGYLERALKANHVKGQGKYFVGDKASIADVTVWQALDGLKFGFPKEITAREQEFPLLYGTFYPAFKSQDRIREYLASERRLKYSDGVWRYYPELDRQD